jgi:argininosuccinate lyase
MKLWDKDIETDKIIEDFTIGEDRDLDISLAKYDVLGSLAHIRMLNAINLINDEEYQQLSVALKSLMKEIETNEFEIEDGVEDIHSQVELLLSRKLGDTGKKVHSGRSRNDQVLVDLQMYFREEIHQIVRMIKKLCLVLSDLSEQYKDVSMPGYTHMQVAMPSSFGLWFGAYAEGLTDDLCLFKAAWDIVNQNPLGSAAGYGSSFPLDRSLTTRLLGFEKLRYNVISAQMGRGKSEKTIALAMAFAASTISKLAYDICLFAGQNFNFITLPDKYTTGSSIMPHKKNPDIFELIRARSNKLQSLPNEISFITNNLPSGYHRDMQILKESLFRGIVDIKKCLSVLTHILPHIKPREAILDEKTYRYIFSVDAVNQEVLKGMPFRDAYKKIALQINEGASFEKSEAKHTHEGSIGNLCNEEIKEKLEQITNSFGFEKVEKALSELMNSH